MEKINKDGLTREQFLSSYDPDKYKKPAVSVDIIIYTIGDEEGKNLRKLPEKKLKVLMVKRKNHPFIGDWALPGGFVNMDESIEDGAKRELFEETGVDTDHEGIYMEQLYTWGDVKRDPRMRVISTSYISLLNSDKIRLTPGDDASEACWFEIQSRIVDNKRTLMEDGYTHDSIMELKLKSSQEELCSTMRISREVKGRSRRAQKKILENSGIAFDHSLMIVCGLERLRNKIGYTDIAFNLMPRYFTLTELQQVYETILGKELLKANFRRKIDGMVIETDKVKKDTAHRPAKLYMFNPEWEDSIFD